MSDDSLEFYHGIPYDPTKDALSWFEERPDLVGVVELASSFLDQISAAALKKQSGVLPEIITRYQDEVRDLVERSGGIFDSGLVAQLGLDVAQELRLRAQALEPRSIV